MRASFTDAGALSIAKAFGAPVVIDASLRDGSLREAVGGMGTPVVLYEAGEARTRVRMPSLPHASSTCPS